jgi:cation-transporting ATPase F
VNVFVAVEAFYLLNCRSLTHSVWHIGLWSNRWVLVGIGIQALAQLALTYLPVMNRIFGTAPLGINAWLRIIGIGIVAALVVAAEKWIRRHLSEGRRRPTTSRPQRM